MTPVEYLWIELAILFGVIGVIRGFLKELGVTLVLIVTLFALDLLTRNLAVIFNFGAAITRLQAISQAQNNQGLLLGLYVAVVLLMTYIAYQGYVITYPGQEPKGIQGTLLSLMVGLINGYLLAGTLWFYVDKFKGPVVSAGLLHLPYTSLAQRLLQILPPFMLAPYLPYLLIFLIILLVLR